MVVVLRSGAQCSESLCRGVEFGFDNAEVGREIVMAALPSAIFTSVIVQGPGNTSCRPCNVNVLISLSYVFSEMIPRNLTRTGPNVASKGGPGRHKITKQASERFPKKSVSPRRYIHFKSSHQSQSQQGISKKRKRKFYRGSCPWVTYILLYQAMKKRRCMQKKTKRKKENGREIKWENWGEGRKKGR